MVAFVYLRIVGLNGYTLFVYVDCICDAVMP